MQKLLIDKLVAAGTDYNTAVSIVEMINKGWYPRGLTVRQAIIVGWL